MGRTLAVLVTLTLATSMAAREGPVPMAGYQICVQIWMAISLLTDALALAGQVQRLPHKLGYRDLYFIIRQSLAFFLVVMLFMRHSVTSRFTSLITCSTHDLLRS